MRTQALTPERNPLMNKLDSLSQAQAQSNPCKLKPSQRVPPSHNLQPMVEQGVSMDSGTVENLVFEGGGVLGIAYGGVLRALQQRKILMQVKCVAGSSVGAITALLLALGYTATEIEIKLSHINFVEFADDDPGVLRDLYRFITKWGWHKGDTIANWITQQVALSPIQLSPSGTFHDLQLLADQHGLPKLHVVATALSTRTAQVFNVDNTPDVPVALAVRASIGYPVFFTPTVINDDMYVDGGVTNNFPADIFPAHTTLGIRLISTAPSVLETGVPTNIISYLLSIVWAMHDRAMQISVDALPAENTMLITSDIAALNFDIQPQSVSDLLTIGYTSAITYCNNRGFL